MTTGHHGRAARPLPGPRARSWAPAPRGPGGRGWRPCTGSLTKARLAPRHRNPRKAAVPGTAKHPAAAWRVGPLAPGSGDARSPWARICPPAPCSAAAPAPRAPGPGDTAPQGGGPSTGGAGGGCRSRACRLTRPRPGAAGRMASWRWPTGDSDGTAGVTARGWVRPERQCVLQTGARAGTRAAGRVAPGACEWLSPHPPVTASARDTRARSRDRPRQALRALTHGQRTHSGGGHAAWPGGGVLPRQRVGGHFQVQEVVLSGRERSILGGSASGTKPLSACGDPPLRKARFPPKDRCVHSENAHKAHHLEHPRPLSQNPN